jgi:hypothetical protein
MKRWIQALTCVGLLASDTGLHGWGSSFTTPAEQISTSPDVINHFPLSADQEWFVKEAYLIMKPYESDNDYASRLTVSGSTSTSLEMKMRLEKPDFDWYSGVRLGIGRYLANHDKWDVTFYTTYYYAQEKDSSSPDRSKGSLLTPLWAPVFSGGATDGHVTWRLNFFNWDLSIGREFSMLKTITVHPFIGLRGALIYKDYKASYHDNFLSGNNDRILRQKFQATDTFWGIGPRAGVDLNFKFQPGWSFLGSLSAALFYGQFDVEEKISSKVSNFSTAAASKYHLLDKRYCVRANLDTSIGLGWEAWMKNRTVRVAPSILFEASCWFDTNQYFLGKTSSTSSTSLSSFPNVQNFRRQGNLILMGLSFNLQTDF